MGANAHASRLNWSLVAIFGLRYREAMRHYWLCQVAPDEVLTQDSPNDWISMKSTTSLIVVFLGTCFSAPNLASAGKSEANVDFPHFRMQEIYKGFEVGYAV